MAYQPKSYRKYLAGAAAAAVVASAVPTAGFAAASFTDTQGHWAAEAIDYLVGTKALDGMAPGIFAPEADLTRGQASAVLARVLGLDIVDSAKTDFADTKDHWSSKYVKALQDYNSKIIGGYGDGTFQPEGSITRQELAKMVVTAFGYELDETKDVAFDDNNSWGAEYVEILASLGIIGGYGDGTVLPGEKVSRAEAATFVYRSEVPAERIEVKDKEVEVVAPVVENVSAINLNQVKVVFNVAIEKDSAEDISNYTVEQNGSDILDKDGANDDATAELQADGKTVIINLDGDTATDLTANQAVKVTVNGVKTAADEELEINDFAKTFLVSDKQAATVTKVKANSTKDGFIVEFDEPVNTTPEGVAKIDGKPAVISTVANNKFAIEVQYVTPEDLKDGQSYSVYVSGVKDRAGNLSAATTQTVKYVKDVTPAAISSITQKDDKTLKIKFSEELDTSALPTVTVYRDTDEFFNAQLTTGNLDPDDETDTTYLVSLDPTAGGSEQALYKTGETTASVKVDVTAFTDEAGNVTSAKSNTFTLAKSTTAPKVVSTKWDGTDVVVEFDKVLDNTTEDSTKLLITDESGAEVTGYTAAVADKAKADNDGKYVVINGLSADETYTINFLTGFAEDTAVVPNETTAKTFTIKTSATTGDIVKPEIETDAAVGAGTLAELVGASANGTLVTSTATGNVIEIAISEAVAASATSLSNFKLDGAALPAGSVVTLGKGAVSTTENRIIKISLPESGVSYDGDYEVTLSNIKDLAGNVMDTESVVVTLDDTVDPVLTAAKINSDNTVTLTLSEDLSTTTFTGADASDLKVELNGVVLAASQFEVADDDTANDNVIELTFTGVNVVGQDVKVTTKEGASVILDNSNQTNAIKAKTTVTATK